MKFEAFRSGPPIWILRALGPHFSSRSQNGARLRGIPEVDHCTQRRGSWLLRKSGTQGRRRLQPR